jgi:hypothetical protein
MSKKSTKAVAKKSAAKKVSTKATKKPNALHAKLLALMSRKDGATLADLGKVGFKAPAIQALRIAERRGMKTRVVKPEGELKRYIASAR